MPKKARLSHDQKRKQKLAKRQRRQPQSESLAYTGSRYKSEELVEPLFYAEKGIYEFYVISDREITDDDVEEGLEELIAGLRARPVSELIAACQPDEDGALEASIPTLVLNQWKSLRDVRGLPARDDLLGILRTILGSLETWRSHSVSSRGYLNYLEGFMNKMGVRFQKVTDQGQPIHEDSLSELYEVGEMWLAGSVDARHQFAARARQLLEQGQSQHVVDACQRLLGSIGSIARPEFAILTELSIRAQKTQQKLASPEFAPGLKSFISRLTGW